MPKVSVIIPSYNHDKFIGKAIESVLNQTFQDFEIVITDDGSTDKSLEVIRSFDDKRIKLFIFSNNLGACAAANNCIINSKGEYIAMLSSDDLFLPNKLEKQVSVLNSHKNIGVVFGYPQMINNDGHNLSPSENLKFKLIFRKKNRTRYKWLKYFFYHGNCLCHPSALIRRECYEDVGLYDRRYASLPDFDLWIRICQKYDIHILEETLIKMRWLENELNASGYRLDNIVRCVWEYKSILYNYLNFSVADFNRIFPEYQLDINDNSTFLRYQLAKVALKVGENPHRMFALELLYEIMKDQEIAALIETKSGFSYQELVRTAGEANLFMIQERKAFLPGIYSDTKHLVKRILKKFLKIF